MNWVLNNYISSSWYKELLFPIFVFLVLLFFCSCSQVLRSYSTGNKLHAGKVIIDRNVDLGGKIFSVPEGCTLVFRNKGLISNGTIIGNNTKIKYNGTCFDKVIIKGTWCVPEIRSSMFITHDDNSLANLFNLQSNSIKNTIYILPGIYHINANTQRAALYLKSNTTLQVDGDLILDKHTNNKFYNGYYAIEVEDVENVVIKGKGSIRGDLGRSGLASEYGHGICVFQSKNVTISGLTIKDFQGDGIALSIGNDNITIDGVSIDHYYRNGISVVDGSNISINNIMVKNGGISDPYAAIDIEPNEGGNINNVKIKNLTISNCTVGIMGYVSKNAKVDNIIYQDVKMMGISQCCLSSSNFTKLEMVNVSVKNIGENAQIMRFIGNKYLSLSRVDIEAWNNKTNYPFYLDNKDTRVVNCSFICPKMFSWHLSNVQFVNTFLKFDSFVWTAADIANSNLLFDQCVFDGLLYMRPNNVTFSNSFFRNTHSTSQKNLVRFEDANNAEDASMGVTMEDNTFEIGGNVSETSAVECLTRRSTISKSKFKRQ